MSAHTYPRNGGRRGRPRDPQIDAAIQGATLVALDDVGYAGLTLEDVDFICDTVLDAATKA